MSYMGPRYVGGGGQIFPNNQQNQSFQPQNVQRQYQVMQMQMQLQQKIQMQKLQRMEQSKTSDTKDNKSAVKPKDNATPNSGPGQNSAPNSGPNKTQSNSNMNRPNAGQNQRPNQNTNSKPMQNQNQNNVQRNMNSNQNQQDRSKPLNNSSAPNNSKLNNPSSNQDRKPNNPQNKDMKDNPNDKSQNMSRFGPNKPQDSPAHQGKPMGQQGSLMGKAPQAPLMGNKPPGSLMGNKPQGSLLAKPPAPPLLNNPQNQDIKNEHNQNKGQGRPNQNNYNMNHSNQHDSYDDRQRNQNQQNRNNNYGKGQYNTQKSPASHNQDASYNRSGRNMGGQNDYQNRSNMQNRSGQQSGGSKQPGGGSSNYRGSRNYYGADKVKDKVLQMFTEPQVDLPALDISEKKFNAYAKLFVGNIPKNYEQSELVSLFEKYGEIGSVYVNKESSFAFINFDFKANAAKAQRELDNTSVKNRYLKVRFATLSEGIRIKNLSPYISNELLEKAFSVFGVVEACRVVVDDRGSSKGEGIVIFRDKKAAVLAIKKCQEECYFLSGAMRPVVVTALEPSEDNVEGLPESILPKNDEYHSERQVTPHFADSNSFEFEFGVQWKQLFIMYDEKKSVLDRDFQIELERLEKKMVLAKVEFEAEKLRKELAQREAESAQLRRHFEFSRDNMGNASMGPGGGSGSGNYDPYSGGVKRPHDQGYEGGPSGPYDNTYSDNYDRSGYNAADYDRNYDQSYGSYNREDYMREGGYNNEDQYNRSHYDRPAEVPAERSSFETPLDPTYSAKAPEAAPVNDAYNKAAPNKRPRY